MNKLLIKLLEQRILGLNAGINKLWEWYYASEDEIERKGYFLKAGEQLGAIKECQFIINLLKSNTLKQYAKDRGII